MATLREPVKIFIVQALACFETPQQVADAVKQEFGIEILRQQVAAYDPTKPTGKNLSKKLRVLFENTRESFKQNVFDIPLANKSFRLNELQKIYNNSKGSRLKQNLIKQARDEMNGHAAQLLDVELKNLAIQKIRDGEDGAGDDPTPVTVTINVVDASKKDAEHQSDVECTSG
ncbi:MAG: DUF2280 domain-containing protein [Acinetobacter sp.]|nr:DUF2280 domain-containing protein [Acinetobacter sp.]